MEKEVVISGIQQMGIGVPNVEEAWKWYKEFFGVDVVVFDEWADAEFMLPYTGGTPKSRHAMLALNLQGGGGFEIWQHTSFEPRAAAFDLLPGDLGIYACKIKCKDAQKYYDMLVEKKQNVSPAIYTDAIGRKFFYLTDPYKNLFQIIEPEEGRGGWLFDTGHPTGGVFGAVIGSHDILAAKKFYAQMQGYDVVLADEERVFDDLSALGTPGTTFRRMVLTHSETRKGPFAKVFGPSEIELIQAIDRPIAPRKIFEGRMWGELGYIQVCFDIRNMDALRQKCNELGYPFTVDSQSYKSDFEMGDAGGDFAYNEDPSGTWVEYVQTNKVSIVKRKHFSYALDLSKKSDTKSLPTWMLWCLRFLRK